MTAFTAFCQNVLFSYFLCTLKMAPVLDVNLNKLSELQLFYVKNIRGDFTLLVGDPPYLIIAGNCHGNMK